MDYSRTFVVYRITCTKAPEAEVIGEDAWLSLHPWGKNSDEYEGHDDGGREYFLPDTHEIALTLDGFKEIRRKDEALKGVYSAISIGKDGELMLEGERLCRVYRA